jgi:hypothetical protein
MVTLSFHEGVQGDAPSPEPERFQHFALSPLLPDGYKLILDMESDILVLLFHGELVELQSFTPQEMAVLLPFLANYPDYCPQEEVLHHLTGKSRERCSLLIQQSLVETGNRDHPMRPVRNQLNRLRVKLVPFGIKIKAIQQMGYMLLPHSAKEWTKLS